MNAHEPEMTPARTEAIRELLAANIRDEPALRRRRTHRRWLIWGGIGVFAVGSLGTAGSILFNAVPITDKSIVYCLSSTVPGADGEYPGSAAMLANPDGPPEVDDALALCSDMWRHGLFRDDFDPLSPTYGPIEYDVPELQTCVRRDGAAAVVPGDSPAVCQSIGLSKLER
jgi:hypothetical protein